jgi:hypothetical protein
MYADFKPDVESSVSLIEEMSGILLLVGQMGTGLPRTLGKWYMSWHPTNSAGELARRPRIGALLVDSGDAVQVKSDWSLRHQQRRGRGARSHHLARQGHAS